MAIPLLKDITDKYVPRLISHADLWALAANVSGAENQTSRCGENGEIMEPGILKVYLGYLDELFA